MQFKCPNCHELSSNSDICTACNFEFPNLTATQEVEGIKPLKPSLEDEPDMAAKIARQIMALGDKETPCQRLQFKCGYWPAWETDNGGLCEDALAMQIRPHLKSIVSELAKLRAVAMRAQQREAKAVNALFDLYYHGDTTGAKEILYWERNKQTK